MLILFLFGIANIQAANRIEKTNDFIKGIQKEIKLDFLYPIYNGYCMIGCLYDYRENYRNRYTKYTIDIKKRKLININTFVRLIAKGGFVFQDAGYEAEYPEDEIMGKITNINGETLLDSVTDWLLSKKHFLTFRHAGADTTFEISSYKNGRLIRKDTIHSDLQQYNVGMYGLIAHSVVHNKYCWINGSLYDEKLNKLLTNAGWGTFEMSHHNYREIYPKNLYIYTLSGDSITFYNKRCKKKYTIDRNYWSYGLPSIMWDKKLIVLDRRGYDLKGTPITPENHYFSGYYNKYLIYNNNEETFAMTLDKTQSKKIKLGRCRLEKNGKKWVLRTPTSTDTLDNITGINSDKHIGISVGNKIGIIDKNGNTIVPPCYREILIDNLYYIGNKNEYGHYDLYDKNGTLLAKGMDEFLDNEIQRDPYELPIEYGYKPDRFRYFIFKESENKYRYFLRKKKKSKVFYADDINLRDLSNRFLPIKKDGIWQFLEIK